MDWITREAYIKPLQDTCTSIRHQTHRETTETYVD